MQLIGEFELFNYGVRRLANGDKARVVLEMPEDITTEKKLIDFRGEYVKCNIKQAEGDKEHTSVFEVFDVRVRRLANQNKLTLILENLYSKAEELAIVGMRFDEVEISWEKVEKELFDKIDSTENEDTEGGE